MKAPLLYPAVSSVISYSTPNLELSDANEVLYLDTGTSQLPYSDFQPHFDSRTLLTVSFSLVGMSVANNPFKAKIPFFPSVENSIE
jgi:hypothetical protein